jgi:hypothetical protein
MDMEYYPVQIKNVTTDIIINSELYIILRKKIKNIINKIIYLSSGKDIAE